MSWWVNYDDVLGQLREGGLLIDGLEVDTPRPKRCRVDGMDNERRGWYWLHEILINDGQGAKDRYIVGAWGIFQGADSGKRSVALRRDGKAQKLTREQRDALTQRLRQNQRRLKAMREAEAEQAAILATGAWRKYVPQGKSRYLERKGVPAFGLRFHPGDIGTIAVPMTDQLGRIWGLQVIRDKVANKNRREKEYWPKGLQVQGHYHLIGGTPRYILLLAEGYASAASLHLATGLPVACAFDAGNLRHVASAFKKRDPGLKVLVCADDDWVRKCRVCRGYTPAEEKLCLHCGKDHGEKNVGIVSASTAALAVDGKWIAPVFAAERPADAKGASDFNDLHMLEGLQEVRAQIERCLAGLGWDVSDKRQSGGDLFTGGSGGACDMPPRLTIDEAVERYWGTYGFGGKTLFDERDRCLVHRDDVFNLLPRGAWDRMREHPDWRVARKEEIGFDPTEADDAIKCNLYGGWPTQPRPGCCERTLELLAYLCNHEDDSGRLYQWVLKWLAYPIQHPGAKMKSSIVVHGPQGTGKSMVFEAICQIYGRYGSVVGQDILEDRFNSDWAECKLYILADEIVAGGDKYHTKNRIKTFITGKTIRINPKNLAAHNERNHWNLVFLSNEVFPVVLESDDRRHCVIWTPPELAREYYDEVEGELQSGGIEALHQYLLDLDLGDFKPWTKPPMTRAKEDLVDLGLSSEQRFVKSWSRLEVEGENGEPVPFCPCLSTQLYRTYERWCRAEGEPRPRPAVHFLNFVGKISHWKTGPVWTWVSLRNQASKKRRMVIPAEADMQKAAPLDGSGAQQQSLLKGAQETQAEWLTRCLLAFSMAVGLES